MDIRVKTYILNSLSFVQFQCASAAMPDLGVLVESEAERNMPGRIYPGKLWVAMPPGNHPYARLPDGTALRRDDVLDIEIELYQYALANELWDCDNYSMETQMECIANGSSACPECKSKSIVQCDGGDYTADPNELFMCEDCGERWETVYRLVEIHRWDNVNDDKEEPANGK